MLPQFLSYSCKATQSYVTKALRYQLFMQPQRMPQQYHVLLLFFTTALRHKAVCQYDFLLPQLMSPQLYFTTVLRHNALHHHSLTVSTPLFVTAAVRYQLYVTSFMPPQPDITTPLYHCSPILPPPTFTTTKCYQSLMFSLPDVTWTP